MNDELVELIKQRGYWRLNFRPAVLPAEEHSLTDCLSEVSNATVQLRGWYYPHVPGVRDDMSGMDRLGNCVQSWSSWSWHLEFWRMYSSEQFLQYVALSEDWRHENCNVLSQVPPPPEARRLDITSSTWLIAEAFEFLSRLSSQGLYASGAQVSIQLHNSQGRALRVDEVNRIPFAVNKETQAELIDYTAKMSADEVRQPKPQAQKALFYIYDRFGWQPNATLLKNEVERLYAGHRAFG